MFSCLLIFPISGISGINNATLIKTTVTVSICIGLRRNYHIEYIQRGKLRCSVFPEVWDKSMAKEKKIKNMKRQISDDWIFLDKMEWSRYEICFNYKISWRSKGLFSYCYLASLFLMGSFYKEHFEGRNDYIVVYEFSQQTWYTVNVE